ncbi:MAG: Gfo/Idh/MocA family protein [Terriglobales bacterium]
MRAIVVGGGSIGFRHLKNLKLLGIEELGLIEINEKRRGELATACGATPFTSLADGLEWLPDFAVVCTPNHLHMQQTLEIAQRGCHVFVEKPLSHTTVGLAQLCNLVDSQKLVSLVGCNMRFHPGPSKVKELIEQNACGRILFARIHAGFYLPEWRPNADYRDNYAAREDTGGGCILDGIHEIDLARWYLGDVTEVFCLADHLSSLVIDTEDVATLICRHSSGVVSEIHLDYVQRTYQRGCQIVGETGSIFWEFGEKQVRWYDAGPAQWTNFSQPDDWKLNQMYVDEMQHFLDCVQSGQKTALPISEAISVMKIVFAAKASGKEKKMIAIGGGMLP